MTTQKEIEAAKRGHRKPGRTTPVWIRSFTPTPLRTHTRRPIVTWYLMDPLGTILAVIDCTFRERGVSTYKVGVLGESTTMGRLTLAKAWAQAKLSEKGRP